MDPFTQLIYSQRPDVQGHPANDWWQLWGANELRQQLAALGRQDVLDNVGNNDELLKMWYTNNGTQEYPNIWQASQVPAAPQPGMAEQFTASAGSAPKAATFEETLPYEKAWGALAPTAYQSALQQISPEIMRQYNAAKQSYMNALASSGGGRFGRGMGGLGTIQAESERSKKAQALDWTNVYEQGFRDLWYTPQENTWASAMTQGKTPRTPAIPTWENYASQYNAMNPGTPITTPPPTETNIRETRTPSVGTNIKGTRTRGLY
jgi:hypothetical protein